MMSDTGSMWASMLGLGDIMKTVNDPAFHAQIGGFLASVTDLQQRVTRIEAKLDFLIAKVMQNGHANIEPVAIAFTELGTDGTGTRALASGATDNGTGGAGASVSGTRSGVGTAGNDGINGAAGP
jgi:hypothetical protein